MAYIQSDRGQAWLLPPSLEDLIPEDHICFMVESLVDSLNYRSFDIRYSGAGHPAYHPRVLMKLLIMGVLDRVRSSRRLARNARENVVYMYLSEKLSPDFRTISDFRKDNPELIKEAFKHTVGFAKEEGMLDLSHLSTDGSKVKANASNRRMLTKEELAVLLRFVDEELEEWARQDTIEDGAYDDIRGMDQLPKQNRKTIRKAAEYYMKRVKESGAGFKEAAEASLTEAAEEAEKEGLSKVSVTDPDSRFMKNKSGRIELSYNVQVTADRGGVILANDVCKESNDFGQLKPQVEQTEENLGGLSENTAWSFDAGYFEGGNMEFLSDREIDGYVPDKDERKADNPYDRKNFEYDEGRDVYICPEKREMFFLEEFFSRQKGKLISVYRGRDCGGCDKRSLCTKGAVRRIRVFEHERARSAMAAKMKTHEAKKIYKLRQQIVEPVIGDIKENKGLRMFLTRGIKAVKAEFDIICAAVNVKRIWTYLQKRKEERMKILCPA